MIRACMAIPKDAKNDVYSAVWSDDAAAAQVGFDGGQLWSEAACCNNVEPHGQQLVYITLRESCYSRMVVDYAYVKDFLPERKNNQFE